jgi:hypothetical protein
MRIVRLRLGVLLLLLLPIPAALALTAHLVTGNPLDDHAPGDDLRIGTSDDPIIAHPSGVGSSDSGPNTHGAASFALLNGSAGAPYPTWSLTSLLFGFDYVLFVDGTLQFEPDWEASSLSDVVIRITGCGLRSTAEFGYDGGGPGSRGESITTGCTGTAHLDPMTGTASVVLTGTFTAPFDPIPLVDQTLTAAPGKAKAYLRSQFGTSGDAYVDDVLTPLLPDTASALIVVEFTGRTVEATHQDWPSRGVLAAYTTDDLGCASLPLLPCGATTTTTLPGGGCTTFATCEPTLLAALPDVATVTGKAKKTARMIGKLERKAARAMQKADGATAVKRLRFYAKARTALQRLAEAAVRADARGRLGVPLGRLQSAVTLVLGVVPG